MQQQLPKPHYLRPNGEQQELNEFMKLLVPELESELAATPMALGNWYPPSHALDNGTPCFIEAEEPKGLRQDYIWMPKRKDLQAGYYHFRTQEAYIEVYCRLKKAGPRGILFSNNSSLVQTKKEKKMYRKLKELIYNRLVSEVPSDVHAARMRLLNLQSEGSKATAFGKAAYLPTISTVLLSSLTNF